MIELERFEWLENYVKEKGHVHIDETILDFAERFDIGKNWSHRKISWIIKESYHLTKKRRIIFYA